MDKWTSELADLGIKHLQEDTVILFPILAETDGLGSLAEIGFAIESSSNHPKQPLFVLVDRYVDETKVTDPALIKASNRVRALVISKLESLKYDRDRNLTICKDIDHMFRVLVKGL